jgi:hypothetical protein
MATRVAQRLRLIWDRIATRPSVRFPERLAYPHDYSGPLSIPLDCIKVYVTLLDRDSTLRPDQRAHLTAIANALVDLEAAASRASNGPHLSGSVPNVLPC